MNVDSVDAGGVDSKKNIDMEEIRRENDHKLSEMGEKEILKQQRELLETLGLWNNHFFEFLLKVCGERQKSHDYPLKLPYHDFVGHELVTGNCESFQQTFSCHYTGAFYHCTKLILYEMQCSG